MDLQEVESKLLSRPTSPLFARLASEYLSRGRLHEAKRLLEDGLRNYPSYATAHLILAKCFAAERDFTGALQRLHRAIDLLPGVQPLRSLLSQWEKQRLQEIKPSVEEQSALVDTPTSTVGAVVAEVPVDYESPPTTSVIVEEAPEKAEAAPSFRLRPFMLEEPVVERMGIPAGVSAEEKVSAEWDDDGRIVSKTLAEIYASQGAYGEAVLTYQLLRRRKPENAADYDRRIQELEAKLTARLEETVAR